MTCRELIDFLGAYVDEELSDEVRLELDGHIAECPECSTYLATYRETVTLAKDALRNPDEPVPASVPETLVKAILAARRKR